MQLKSPPVHAIQVCFDADVSNVQGTSALFSAILLAYSSSLGQFHPQTSVLQSLTRPLKTD